MQSHTYMTCNKLYMPLHTILFMRHEHARPFTDHSTIHRACTFAARKCPLARRELLLLVVVLGLVLALLLLLLLLVCNASPAAAAAAAAAAEQAHPHLGRSW